MTQAAAILGCAGYALSKSERAFFAQARPWGFILFTRNIKNAAQVIALTSELREAVGYDAPILIDQEGGRVQRLRGPVWREWHPPMDMIAMSRDPARAMYLRSVLIAHELQGIGIDVNCAPTCDVAREATHPFLQNRLYGRTPEAVLGIARAVMEGHAAGGVSSVVKHIPGHGLGTKDSHLDLPQVSASRATLNDIDFHVFKGLSDATLGMTAHVVYDQIDPDHPATMSAEVINLIRHDIGFEGLLMTDDLSMNALAGGIGTRTAAARAAGCDVILHCNGDRSEMEAVLTNCGALDGAAKARADAAARLRPEQQSLDIHEVERELSKLLDGEVYV